MILTVVGISYGLLDDVARRTRGVGADILVRPPGSSIVGLSSAPMSEKILDVVRAMPNVSMVTGTAVHPIGGLDTVTGIDIQEFDKLSGGFRYLAGGPFKNPDDVLIDERLARQRKLTVGSTMEMMNRKWRVAGIVESGKLARIFLPLRLLQELSANTGRLTVVYVKVDDPKNTDDVVAALKTKLPGYPVYSMEEFASLLTVDNVAGSRAFINVVIGLSVIVGFIVVSLSMYTAVLERTREIGILKSLGATPGFIVNVLARETSMLALAGSVLGILLTYGTRWLIMNYVPGSLSQNIVPSWWPIATGIAIAGALLGAVYPGWKAARQDPIEALSYE
jgi:putative ABC transport system permease protein